MDKKIEDIRDYTPAPPPGVSFQWDVIGLAIRGCEDVFTDGATYHQSEMWYDELPKRVQHKIHMLIVNGWTNWPDEDQEEEIRRAIVRLRSDLGYIYHTQPM